MGALSVEFASDKLWVDDFLYTILDYACFEKAYDTLEEIRATRSIPRGA
jgi:hypothetical protein